MIIGICLIEINKARLSHSTSFFRDERSFYSVGPIVQAVFLVLSEGLLNVKNLF